MRLLKLCKYPKSDGWRHVWVFDNGSCHNAMANDALDVTKMNVNPGDAHRKIRDTVWQGRVQKMTFNLGIPKGMQKVLEERGVNPLTPIVHFWATPQTRPLSLAYKQCIGVCPIVLESAVFKELHHLCSMGIGHSQRELRSVKEAIQSRMC